ncbi:THO complex subunit 6 protein [Trichuris trichiura]|uniref:THO complex subunit 6 protein n=1 Tax=Trichuris trichiura TaxID=36087 RepID=A0A077Z7L6_TRITR|nr:THO complex subunit 6 protein [Trichuris trichiura]
MVASAGIKRYYNTTFGAVFSANATHLVCCNRYGYLLVFDVCATESNESGEDSAQAEPFKFRVCNGPIYALQSVGDLLCWYALLTGTYNGDVFIYHWEDIIEHRPKCLNILRSESVPSSPCCPLEVNALAFDAQKPNCLYSAGGDCIVYSWDLETSKIQSQRKEHTNYIHCLAVHDSGLVLSGGEDGCVKCFVRNESRIIDERSAQSVATMQPHLTGCQRTDLGDWIGCITTYKEFMICGGGAGLGVWYLGSFELLKPLEDSDVEWYAASRQKEFFFTGGSDGRTYRWTLNGDLLEKIGTPCFCIYDIRCADPEADSTEVSCFQEILIFSILAFCSFLPVAVLERLCVCTIISDTAALC